jgi:hypothetical protein
MIYYSGKSKVIERMAITEKNPEKPRTRTRTESKTGSREKTKTAASGRPGSLSVQNLTKRELPLDIID